MLFHVFSHIIDVFSPHSPGFHFVLLGMNWGGHLQRASTHVLATGGPEGVFIRQWDAMGMLKHDHIWENHGKSRWNMIMTIKLDKSESISIYVYVFLNIVIVYQNRPWKKNGLGETISTYKKPWSNCGRSPSCIWESAWAAESTWVAWRSADWHRNGWMRKKNNIPKKDRNLIVFPSKEWGSNTPFLYFIGVSVVDLLQLSQVCNWNS